jgi:endo-1,4-beta-D-glucanase Y
MKKTRIISIGCIVLAVLFFAAFAVGNDKVPMLHPYSGYETLQDTWNNYKKNTMQGDARAIDTSSSQGQDITTSEGQSYALLRAVWMADKDTFDKTLAWTNANLQQPNHLFAWLYGKNTTGKDSVLTSKNGQNSASDADTDIALSLVFAYSRWNDKAYLQEADSIINAIWENEVIEVNGTPYLVANNKEKSSQSPLINPSYLEPYAYRIFALADRQHDWGKVVDSSYRVFNESIYSPLDKKQSANLPPDWVRLNIKTGKLEAPHSSGQDTNFGYDATRVPFRVALDKQWYDDPRDAEVLYRLGFIEKAWQDRGFLFSVYSHDGQVVENYENPASYGTTIGYFMATDPKIADQVFSQKLEALYDSSTHNWKKPLPYYDDNWTWFGMALYYNQLPNLAKSSTF